MLDVYKRQVLYNETIRAVKNNCRISQEISVTQGVRHGCSISPTLFNIYINDLVRKWKLLVNLGITLSRDRYLNVLLFAYDLLVLQDTDLI